MISSLRLAYLSGLYGFRALFAWSSPGLFVVSLVVTPLLQVFFFVTLGNAFEYGSPSFFIIGNSVQVAAAAGISGMVSVIADERQAGTLASVVGAPSSTTVVFAGRTLPGIVLGFVVSVFTAIVGFSLAGISIPADRFGTFVLLLAIAAFSCSALGLFLSAVGLLYRDIYQIAGAAYLVLLVVSGANIVRDQLPAPLVLLGNLLPQANAIDAARILISDGPMASVQFHLLWELGVGAVWLLVALAGMKLLTSASRRRGTLELY